MSILELNKNSTSGINNFKEKSSLSEWAVEFIHEQKFTREKYFSTDVFRNLTRRQKDAVRYQLRKEPPPPKAMQLASEHKHFYINYLVAIKVALGVWISIFLLIDIPKIYIAKGASPTVAWQAAILVEICILFASLSTKAQLRRIAFALFAYNILLFGFMELDQIAIKLSSAVRARTVSDDNENTLKILNQQLKEQLSESSKNLARLDSDHARGFVTSGSIAFEKVSKSINSTSSLLSAQIQKLEEETWTSKESQHGTLWIYATSLLYFLLRCLLQGFSIMLLKREN